MASIVAKIADFLLFTTREYFMVSLCSIGYLSINRRVFSKAIVLMLFTFIYHSYLKHRFNIPQSNSLGYAFPIDKMHISIVFWGFLFLELRDKVLRIISILAILLIAFSLLYRGHHSYSDILASTAFASLTLLLFYYINRYFKRDIYLVYISLALLILNLFLMYTTPIFMDHFYISIGGCLGFTLGYYYTTKERLFIISDNFPMFKCFIGMIGILFFYFSFSTFSSFWNSPALRFVQFFMLTFWVSYLVEKTVSIIKK